MTTFAAALRAGLEADPFNAVATIIFGLAIIHTFAAARFADSAHRVQHRHDEAMKRAGRPPSASVAAEALHFLGEIEVVFGLWAVALMFAMTAYEGWDRAKHYVNDTVNYTEPMFVVVIMTLASSRPIVNFAETTLKRVAGLGGGTPAAWWLTILVVGPLLGSFITEPAAMTICALLLARRFYDLTPAPALRYATLGLLFVNVSIGGTLTHFAAPPVLMVARHWDWTTGFMLQHFGWRAILAIVFSSVVYLVVFRKEFAVLRTRRTLPDVEEPAEEAAQGGPALLPVPVWVTAVHIGFLAWTVANAHYPALFVGGMLFFLGFARATAVYQSRVNLKAPLLVGFFLAGLVIHGGLQGWWISPLLSSLSRTPLMFGALGLTAFNDNALITYLATLVPDLSDALKIAVVQGAVAGGGLTVIANAPNPAGQALLSEFFDGAIHPMRLAAGALFPTAVAAAAFRLL